MKRFGLLLCFFLFILFLSNNLIAQRRNFYESPFKTTVFLGLSIPQGIFGNNGTDNVLSTAGYSQTGFSALIEINRNLVKNINWSSDFCFSLNSIDKADLESNMQPILQGAKIKDIGSFLTFWLTTGFNGEVAISPTIIIYGTGQIGLLTSFYPTITVGYNNVSVDQKTDVGIAVAHGLGAGLRFDKFDIGLKYFGSEPVYQQKASYQGYNLVNEKVQIPTSILLIVFGYKL